MNEFLQVCGFTLYRWPVLWLSFVSFLKFLRKGRREAMSYGKLSE